MFDENGKIHKECITIEPPSPIIHYLYRCDKIFHVESILKLYGRQDIYGLVYITGNECKLYSFYQCAGHIKSTLLNKKSVDLAKSHKKGGQSQARIGRLHDESHHNYVTLMNDRVTKTFISDNNINIKGLILAGNAQKKDHLEKKLDYRLKKIFLGSIRCDNEDSLFEKCIPLIKESKEMADEKIIKNFMNEFDLMRNKAIIVYGPDHVKTALYYGKMKELIIHQDAIETFKITDKRMKIIKKTCSNIGCTLHIINSYTDLISRFIELGGIGGILWYAGAMDDE